MKEIDSSQTFLPFLCIQLGYHPTVLAQCIVCVENGKPIAGVIYDHYNSVSVQAHIWVAEGAVPSREWYVAIFDYPFNRLEVRKIVGQVQQDNELAQKLDEHFGFVLEARVTDFSAHGDLLMYTMTRDQCLVLNSPLWRKVAEKIKRIA